MHTRASDGRSTISEMAKAAKAHGYEYIAICDHSKASVVANGLSIARMEQHIEDIRTADKRIRGIAILVGCECDIMSDGSLDYPDDLLARCDLVVASIHSAMGPGGSGKLNPTERTLAAMENRYVSIIGHPTGRLIGMRNAYAVDVPAIVAACAETGTCLELNASPERLDIRDVVCREAKEAGVKVAINSDAHHALQYGLMQFGVATARRGWLEKGDVINCMTPKALLKFLRSMKAGNN